MCSFVFSPGSITITLRISCPLVNDCKTDSLKSLSVRLHIGSSTEHGPMTYFSHNSRKGGEMYYRRTVADRVDVVIPSAH